MHHQLGQVCGGNCFLMPRLVVLQLIEPNPSVEDKCSTFTQSWHPVPAWWWCRKGAFLDLDHIFEALFCMISPTSEKAEQYLSLSINLCARAKKKKTSEPRGDRVLGTPRTMTINHHREANRSQTWKLRLVHQRNAYKRSFSPCSQLQWLACAIDANDQSTSLWVYLFAWTAR